MEPIYYDGQTVLVRKQPAVDIGETGIYIINGNGFIKRNGGDHLISINSQYDDIYFSESDTVQCAGKVIGVVQEWKSHSNYKQNKSANSRLRGLDIHKQTIE